MLRIRLATLDNLIEVHRIAHATWPIAYGEILSPDQLQYMLSMTYHPDSLREQLEVKGHLFYMAEWEGQSVGFISLEPSFGAHQRLRIHKLYVLPDQQGKGIGRVLLEHATTLAKQHGNAALELNVNRYNPARFFYESCGFTISYSEDIAIGNGYLMEDYVMVKEVGIGYN
ncbi:MAG: GNAT family N-acetyltransferase [Saprospiraceae bacterium]